MLLLKYMKRRWCLGVNRQSASARKRVSSDPVPNVLSKSISGLALDDPFNLAFTSVPTMNAPALTTRLLEISPCALVDCAYAVVDASRPSRLPETTREKSLPEFEFMHPPCLSSF